MIVLLRDTHSFIYQAYKEGMLSHGFRTQRRLHTMQRNGLGTLMQLLFESVSTWVNYVDSTWYLYADWYCLEKLAGKLTASHLQIRETWHRDYQYHSSTIIVLLDFIRITTRTMPSVR